jgi:enolase-phosphatase E1
MWPDAGVRSAVLALAAAHRDDAAAGLAPPPWPSPPTASGVTAYALWLMDRDRKSPGLKTLQGLVWALGYERGELQGQLFDDVAPAFARVRAAGARIAIYSSGSVLSQRLIFQTTPDGDLTPLISAYCDTAVGPKTSRESYAGIAAALALPPASVLFVSDVTAELVAARDAGMRVALSVRPGNAPGTPLAGVPVWTDLASL